MATIGIMRVGPPESVRGVHRLTFGELGEWLFVLSSIVWSRLFILGFWIFDPEIMRRAFSSWLLPAIGFLLVPWTTFTYLWMWGNSSDGVHGREWVLIAAGLVLDVVTLVAGRRLWRGT
jgi:hypothetical protein